MSLRLVALGSVAALLTSALFVGCRGVRQISPARSPRVSVPAAAASGAPASSAAAPTLPAPPSDPAPSAPTAAQSPTQSLVDRGSELLGLLQMSWSAPDTLAAAGWVPLTDSRDDRAPAALWTACAALESRILSRWPATKRVGCASSPDGALWATVVDVTPTLGTALGKWFLLRLPPDSPNLQLGALESFTEQDHPCGGGGSVQPPGVLLFFDFDGDGRHEAAAPSITTLDVNCSLASSVHLYAAGATGPLGRFVAEDASLLRRTPPLRMERSIASAGDVDGDGRPDLLVDPYGSEGTIFHYGGSIGGTSSEWTLLMRSLPDGTFSLTDPVALAYAKGLCPTAVSEAELAATPLRELPAALHCARLWAMPPAVARQAIDQACVRERQRAPYLPFCPLNQATLRRMAATRLPLSLR